MATDQEKSWFSRAFAEGKDLFNKAEKKVEEAEVAVVQKAKDAKDFVEQKAKGGEAFVLQAAKQALGGGGGQAAPKKSGVRSSGTAKGPSSGLLALSGSVGRGGKNRPPDVTAVQEALNRVANAGLVADGHSGPRTIAAIEAFQRSLGQSKPDGRVDPGGATARALAGGVIPPPPPPPTPPPPPSTRAKIIALVKEVAKTIEDLLRRLKSLAALIAGIQSVCLKEKLVLAAELVLIIAAAEEFLAAIPADAVGIGEAIQFFATLQGLLGTVLLLHSAFAFGECLGEQLEAAKKEGDKAKVGALEKSLREFKSAVDGIQQDLNRLADLARQMKDLALQST